VKRIAVFLLAAAAGFGCETAVSSDVIDSPSPVKCLVTLAAPPMIDGRGGSGSLEVTTQPECTWDASTNVSWISALSPSSGQGPANVSFRVAANDGSSTRDGMIVVNGVQVRVSQRAACRYDVSPSSQSIGADGGAGTLRISTSDDCSWAATSDAAWIALTSTAEGNGNGTVSFTVERNRGDARTGAIAVAGQRSTVAQAGVEAPSPPPPAPPAPPPPSPPTCTYAISPRSDNASVAGDTGTVQVSTAGTCTWKASSNASWISVASGASGTGNGSVRYQVSANSGASRTGTLTIAGQTFTVTQAAFTCSFSISPSRLRLEATADSGTVAVSTSSGCRWTASSNAAWIVVTSGASGTGNGTVNFRTSANTGNRDREGTLTIADRTATIEQRANRGRGNDDDDDDDD
jgi:hypothetical protein